MYFIVVMMALMSVHDKETDLMSWVFMGLLFMVLIGFRYEVGGDWFNYVRHFDNMYGVSFSDVWKKDDPGHYFLNWLSYRWDLGVYGTNVVYGIIFMLGLIRFSRVQIHPWLVMVAAVPYLIVVVAMGYSRQGVAIGIFLLAVTYLQEGKFKVYVILIIIAALFHKTAILLLPLGIFLYGEGLALRLFMIIPIAYGAWDLLLADRQEHLWQSYVEQQMHSDGAKIRVLMNFIPSVLLLYYREEWKKSFNDYSFWLWISLASIASVVLVNYASTAVDRVALYFIPIQLVVFSRLPYLARNQVSPQLMHLFIVLGYSAVLFVWLIFGTHAKYWLPYQNLLVVEWF